MVSSFIACNISIIAYNQKKNIKPVVWFNHQNYLELPLSRMDKPQFLTRTTFDTFNLPNEVLNGLKEVGLTYCTPIQAQTLPISLIGRDVAGQAQTGTGKTAVFLITVFTRLLAMTRKRSNSPSALVIAPTRELASQIHDEAKNLGAHTGFTLVKVVGGIDYVQQANSLRKGADIVIGTPGRIIDYYKQGILKTEAIKIVVVDEADRLLDLGFSKDMRYILRKLPHYEHRQSMLFSATLSYRVMELTYEYMNLPEFISVTPDKIVVEGVEQLLFHVGNEKKLSLLFGLLTRESWVRVLIFVNTKVGVDRLTKRLKGNGWPAEGITGDLHQRKRFRLMEQFKDGKLKILVATDVASRGIHVENISHVINYDLPQDAENYIHRIGRTARAGKQGTALSLACEKYVFHLEPLEEMLGYKIPVCWPDDDWFVGDKFEPDPLITKGRRAEAQQRLERRVKKTSGRRTTYKRDWSNAHPGSFFGLSPEKKTTSDTQPEKDRKSITRKKRKPRHRKIESFQLKK